MTTNEEPQNTKRQWNVPAIISLAIFFYPFVSPILAIVGLVQIRKTHERGKALAITALVLNVLLFFALIGLIIALVVITARQARLEASRLGTDTYTVDSIKRVVDGNCNLKVLESGYADNSDTNYNYTESIEINKVEGSFATGTRECRYLHNPETFVAKKTGLNWQIIYTGNRHDACMQAYQEGASKQLIAGCDSEPNGLLMP